MNNIVSFPGSRSMEQKVRIRNFYIALYDYLIDINWIKDQDEYTAFVRKNQNGIRLFLRLIGIMDMPYSDKPKRRALK